MATERRPNASNQTPTSASAAASAAGAGGAIDVLVSGPRAGQDASYAMYVADAVSAEGATLRGGLLLEKGEEVAIELRLPSTPADSSPVRTRARVTDAWLGTEGAMRVVFVGLSESDQKRLARHSPPTPQRKPNGT